MTTPGAFSLTRIFITPSSVPPDPTLAQDWVGGVMTQWDAVSFANTVMVGPVTYRNLPVVSPNGLTEGTVLLAKGPAGYLVIGMLGTSSAVTLIDPIRYRTLTADLSLGTTTLVDAGILNFLLNENTQYGIDGCLFYNSTKGTDLKCAFDGPANMAAKWGLFGMVPTGSFNLIQPDILTSYGDATTQTIFGWNKPAMCQPRGWFATTDTPGQLQLRAAEGTSNATPTLLLEGSWLRITELGPFGGANTFVKIYTATGSRSYDHNGNPIGSPDQDNNMYTWSLSGRSFGSEAHMWTFDATTMRSDLAGASILSAQMFLFCVTGSSLPADLTWQWSTTSTIAGSFPNNGFSGTDVKNLWQANSWNGFDISSQMSGIINSNANSVLGGSYNFSDSATEFRGYGFSVATRPYIQVTYSI
jgi:hypothetical protein